MIRQVWDEYQKWILSLADLRSEQKKAFVVLLVCFLLLGWCGNEVYYAVFQSTDRVSPYTFVHRSQIHLFEDGVKVDLTNPVLIGFTDTNSMDPSLDAGMFGLMVYALRPNDVHPGDIISFTRQVGFNDTERIAHRVVKVGWDDKGWFAITKGDNVRWSDDGKVRFQDVEGILMGVIY